MRVIRAHSSLELGVSETIRGKGGDANVRKCTWRYSGGSSSFRLHTVLATPSASLTESLLGPSENKAKYFQKVLCPAILRWYSCHIDNIFLIVNKNDAQQSVELFNTQFSKIFHCLCVKPNRDYFSERAAIIHSQLFGRNKWGIRHIRHGGSSIHMDYFAA